MNLAARRRQQGGQSLVEVALVAPLILVLLLFAVDFGRLFLGWVTINNMARIGANYAALNPQGFQDNDAGVLTEYSLLMRNDAANIDCVLPTSLDQPVFAGYNLGDNVTVSTTCDFTLLTPLIGNIIGDGVIHLGGTAVFAVRSGAVDNTPVNPPHITPPPLQTANPSAGATPSATPTAAPTPTSTPNGSASPGPTAPPTPTPLPPVNVSFYGAPATNQPDASGGGPPGSVSENQIVGVVGLNVTFNNTTTGTQVICAWNFGDGSTSSSCSTPVSKIYTTRGVYNVILTVNGSGLTRSNYILISCKVPAFVSSTGNNKIHFNDAQAIWTAAGFTGPITSAPGSNGNFVINYQSLVGGVVNPTGGCGAGIVLGK